MSYRPVDVSWIAERCPEVKEALSHYLKGEIPYEDALKLAIENLYQRYVSSETPYLSSDTLERLRKGELLP